MLGKLIALPRPSSWICEGRFVAMGKGGYRVERLGRNWRVEKKRELKEGRENGMKEKSERDGRRKQTK